MCQGFTEHRNGVDTVLRAQTKTTSNFKKLISTMETQRKDILFAVRLRLEASSRK